MTTFEQIKDLQARMDTLETCLDIAGKRKEVAAKTEETLAPDFWGDPKAAESFLKKLSGLKSWVTDFDKAGSTVEDLEVLYDFAKESLSGADDEAIETAETRELDQAYASATAQLSASTVAESKLCCTGNPVLGSMVWAYLRPPL